LEKVAGAAESALKDWDSFLASMTPEETAKAILVDEKFKMTLGALVRKKTGVWTLTTSGFTHTPFFSKRLDLPSPTPKSPWPPMIHPRCRLMLYWMLPKTLYPSPWIKR
jgi:hypothetical protein